MIKPFYLGKYEQIFRPRQRELNRTPEITDEEFQAPEISEPESLPTVPDVPVRAVQRPAHLKVMFFCNLKFRFSKKATKLVNVKSYIYEL